MINAIICFMIIFSSSFFPTQTHAQDTEYFHADPQFQQYFCNPSSNVNYTKGSTYQTGLTAILDSLVPFSATNYFYSYTQGSGSDQIWTLFYCRYDYTLPECRACVQAAVNKAPNLCPVEKEAVVMYEQCTLRYANRNIFSLEDEDVVAVQPSKYNASMDVDEFYAIVLTNLTTLVNQTAYYSSEETKYYGTLITTITSAYKFYALAQCTPDITAADCEKCLKACFTHIPATEKGRVLMRLFVPSCQMTYGLSLFFRASPVPSTDTGPVPSTDTGKSATFYITRAAIPAVAGILFLVAVWICLTKRRQSPRKSLLKKNTRDIYDVETGVESTDCFQFDLDMIKDATNGFSTENKLGQGGFGIVYQGVLKNGKQVAVKRLSQNSGQGAQEFKTEVAVVAKLQHKNLVRLVGFCVEKEEQILVYEFMPNLSLERFLYDSNNSTLLTWETRNKIMIGIASGLHYLHEDSRVKIVHRDLKISNILLDQDLGPKIADFGMARLVNVDQSTANTVRVVGTYGYMAPEYALAGRFSTKSDVYSYGVMILEILSGKSNNKFYETSNGEGLLRNAWRVWNEGGVEQFMDPNLEKKYSKNEAERYLQIGLLCVQDDETSRPTMHAVLMMLNNNSSELPTPFFPSLISKKMPNFDDDDSRITQSVNQQSEFSGSTNTFYIQDNLHAR